MHRELGDRLAAALAERDDVELAIAFGSRARGNARPDSDLDLAVIGTNVDAVDLAAELSELAGLTVDIVDISHEPPIALLLELLRDGRNVYERRPGAYARFLSHTLMDLETDLPTYRMMQQAFTARVAARGLSQER